MTLLYGEEKIIRVHLHEHYSLDQKCTFEAELLDTFIYHALVHIVTWSGP